MKNTTTTGELSELEIAVALVRAGHPVLRPLSTGLRYDLVLDNGNGTFTRVQCKTGILRQGFVEFNVSSADRRRPNGTPYIGQIEAFGVYCPQNGKVYLVPIERVSAHASRARLRIDPARNGQLRRIRLAAAYEVHAKPGEPRGRRAEMPG